MKTMDATPYLGISYEQATCFQLVKRVYADRGIDIGHYAQPNFFKHWDKVSPDELKELDMLHIDFRGLTREHVGLYVGKGMFLHTIETQNGGPGTSMLGRISVYRKYIRGAYRWRG